MSAFSQGSHVYNTTQADGECQGDLQVVLIDTNMPGQEPSGTGHPDTDTAHKHTGSKHAKAMCLGNTFLCGLMAVTGSLQHHNYNPRQRTVEMSYK